MTFVRRVIVLTATGSDRQRLPIKVDPPAYVSSLIMDMSNSWQNTHSRLLLSGAASTTECAWFTVHGSNTNPDDCGQILYSAY